MLKLLTLYILLSLHQTTTINEYKTLQAWLYILLSLHQTTTIMLHCLHYSVLYILLSLHQTTTPLPITKTTMCCIFFYLYIKPQPRCDGIYITISCIFFYLYIKPQPPGSISVSESVVYSSIFTSNHNDFVMILIQD